MVFQCRLPSHTSFLLAAICCHCTHLGHPSWQRRAYNNPTRHGLPMRAIARCKIRWGWGWLVVACLGEYYIRRFHFLQSVQCTYPGELGEAKQTIVGAVEAAPLPVMVT